MTRDKPPFAEASGDKPPFAEASGDKPPRPNHPRKLHFRGARYRATPPQRGTLFRNGMKVSNPIHRKGELCSATGRGHWCVRVMGMLPKNGGGGIRFFVVAMQINKPSTDYY